MKVVILRSRCTGGIEPRVERVAATLAADGHSVTAFLWDREGAYAAHEARETFRVRRLHLPSPYNRPALLLPLALWLLAAYRATRGADVVHACDLDTLPAALTAKVLRRCRVVYDIFDFYGHLLTANLREETRRRLLRLEGRLATRVNGVILPDKARREVLPSGFPRPVEIVMNTPSDRSVEVPQEEGFVLFVGGNLAPDRGLLESFDALRGVEDVGVHVAGTGELEAQVRAMAQERDTVRFLGELEHDAFLAAMAGAHAVLIWYDPRVPANRYASPNKLFEAMMLGIPVIVSEGTSMAPIVARRGCGHVVPYGDADGLRAAVVGLREDPVLRERMGRKGRAAYEEQYSWEEMESRLRAVYDRIRA